MKSFWRRDIRSFLGRLSGEQRSSVAQQATGTSRVWLHLGHEEASSAELLIRWLRRLRPDLRIDVYVGGGGAFPTTLPDDIPCRKAPPDTVAEASALLDLARPSVIVTLGTELPAQLIQAAALRGIPVVLAQARNSGKRSGLLARRQRRHTLEAASRIFACTEAARLALLQEGAPAERTRVGGQLCLPPDPLPYTEAERNDLSRLIRTRPVWFAPATPSAELATVLAAHRHALRHAHRLLLLLAPTNEGDSANLAALFEADGWRVARRSDEDTPEEDVQIFIVDDPQEYGLWYRLAPITYFGGTLTDTSACSPLEAAALGSAVIHGPQIAPHDEAYRQLDEMRAAWSLRDAGQLGDAIVDLIAPDRCAVLAQAAWAVLSDGAGAACRIAEAIIEEIDTHTAQGG